jgi:hypothetical protein
MTAILQARQHHSQLPPHCKSRPTAKHLEAMVGIAESAGALHEFLNKTAGDTADWPVRIKVDEDNADELCRLMNGLRTKLKPKV